MAQPKVVEAFGERSGVPHPHENEHETIKMYPMVRLSCSCGYDGPALFDEKNNEVICPSEQALLAQHAATQEKVIEDKSPEAVNELVAAAVAKQMAPMQDLIAQLTAQLAAKKKDGD